METWLLDQLCFPLLTFSIWGSYTLGHSHLCHMKRGGESLLLLASLCTRGSRGVATQEVLLHPEKEASQVSLSMGTWGHWCCPGLWDRASASSAAAFSGSGNGQSDNMRGFYSQQAQHFFFFWGKKRKKGGNTPNMCTLSHTCCGCAHKDEEPCTQ